MSIKIANDTANGNVILKGQNVAGDRTITMPNLDCELAPRMQLMTAQNSTSGTSIDFTGIPSWVKKITVMFDGVSTAGTSGILAQLGTSGGVNVLSYVSNACWAGASTGASSATTGYVVTPSGAGINTNIYTGINTLSNISSNTWIQSNSASLTQGASLFGITGGGSKTLSGVLDRVRITTVNGTDTFDAGVINIMYEG